MAAFRRRHPVGLFLGFLLLAGLLPVDTSAADWVEQSINHDGKIRWYRALAPSDDMTGKPLVLLLHGGGQSMRKLFSGRAGGSANWRDLALAHDFLLLVPNGVNAENGDTKGDAQNWNDLGRPGSRADTGADDVGFIRALLNSVQRQYGTDPQRVLITGASNGGMMTYRMVMAAPHLFSAAAVFIAQLPADETVLRRPEKPVPIMILLGSHDKLVRFKGGKIGKDRGTVRSAKDTLLWWIAANNARAEAAKTELPDRAPDDGCRLNRRLFAGRDNGADVLSYVTLGGGHNMPSMKYALPDTPFVRRVIGPQCRDAEGSVLAFDFFKSHWP